MEDQSAQPPSDAAGEDLQEEIECLSQQMADSLHGSQPAVSCSQPSVNSLFSGAPRREHDEMDDIPSSSQETTAPLPPGCYQFPDTILDSRRYPWEGALSVRFFNGSLVMGASDYEHMNSQGKNFGCIMPNSAKKESHHGVTWCFVDRLEGPDLTKYLMQALFLLKEIQELSKQYKWNGFVVRTTNLDKNLYPKFAPGDKEKDVVGVVSKCTIEREASASLGGPGGVNISRLLEMGNQASGGPVSTAHDLVDIYLSFTGAVDDDGRRSLYGIVTAQWLLNVDFMTFITGKLLAPPLRGCANFAEVSERNAGLRDILETLLLKQLSVLNPEDRSGRHPRDFYDNPNAELGAHTLLNPFLTPLKIASMHGLDAPGVRIIGFPDIDWTGNPNTPGPLREYLRYMEGYTTHIVEWSCQILAFCRPPNEENTAGRGRRRRGGQSNQVIHDDDQDSGGAPTEHALKVIPGWPAGRYMGFYHTGWLLDFCPMVMKYRSLVPDPGGNLSCFMVNLGKLPAHVEAHIRFFLFYTGQSPGDLDRINALNMDQSEEKWDLFSVKKKFYGADNLKHLQIATQGCKTEFYNKTVEHIRGSIADGSMSPAHGVRMYVEYIGMCCSITDSMIDNNHFLSTMMTQIRQISKALFAKEEGGTKLYNALNSLQGEVLKKTPAVLTANPIDFYRRTVLQTLVDVNNKGGQMLNSINLSNKLAIIVSVLSYAVGRVNLTTENIGRGVEIAPCAGTAREIILAGNLKEEQTMTNNPNGTGKDMSVETVNKDLLAVQEWTSLMFESPRFTISILNAFTGTSLLLACCIQTANGRVISVPDPEMVRRPCAFTEMRAENNDKFRTMFNDLIKYAFPRGGSGTSDNTAQTTGDNKGIRELIMRRMIFSYGLTTICSNQRLPMGCSEQIDTFRAVNHVVPTGSVVAPLPMTSTAFNATTVNKYTSRALPPSKYFLELSAILGSLQLLCTGFVGPMNDCGFFRAEINKATLGALDWFHLYLSVYVEPLFIVKCQKGRGKRLRKVYEARECARNMLDKVAQHATENQEFKDAICGAVLDFQHDSVALTSCGGLLFTMLYRCLSWVPVFIVRCFVIEVGAPVVPIRVLVKLLTMRDPPRPGDSQVRVWYDRISAWFGECLRESRFCPNPSGGGYSEYISSGGGPDGEMEEQGLLRQGCRYNPWSDQHDAFTGQKLVAACIWKMFGTQLESACALSCDAIVLGVDDILKTFTIAFDQMLGVNIHDSRRHFDFFGVSAQMNFSPVAPPPTAQKQPPLPLGIKAAWMREGRECASAGLGINAMQLLLMASMIGDKLKDRIHPALMEDFSRSLVQQLMLRAPPAMTVSTIVDVPSFNCMTCELQPITLDPEFIDLDSEVRRPLHLLRPLSDQTGVTGEIPLCGSVDIFAHEDVFHCGALFSWKDLLGVPSVLDVPASTQVCYYLQVGPVYCIFNQATGCLGTLTLTPEGASFEAEASHKSPERTGKTLLPLSWHTDLAYANFIVLPMVWRPGACVRLDSANVACLVRDPEADSNFSPVDLSYRALKRFGLIEPIDTLFVMKNLLPLGSRVLLKCTSQSAGALLTRLALPLSPPQYPFHAIRAYLNAPTVANPVDGRVYIAICVQNDDCLTSEDVVVDPWELTLSDTGLTVIEMVRPRAAVARRA